jgi:hypothetical protein
MRSDETRPRIPPKKLEKPEKIQPDGEREERERRERERRGEKQKKERRMDGGESTRENFERP